MSAPRVLWLAKGLGRGGAEQLLATGAAYVDPARFHVEVAYLLPWKDALVPALRRRGLTVHCLGQRDSVDPRWVGRLRRLVRHGRFDVVHTHMPIPAVAARLALGPRGPALVHTEHNVWPRYRVPTRVANAVTYRRNAAVLAVSLAVADSVPRRWVPGGKRVEVLHHGIEIAGVRRGEPARTEARLRLGLPPGAPVVGTVGNMTPKKDHRNLYAAVARIAKTLPETHLVHVGTGPLADQLRSYAGSLGIKVLAPGMRDDVADLLPAFDVFALSSLHEGLSIALIEAMAAGLPVVCTRVGGVPEVVTDGIEGILVPPSAPAALAEALALLLADPARRVRMGAAGAERAAAFDISRAVRRIEQVYDEVLAAR